MASKLKIALVHDYLREYGGAERVIEALHELYPDAPLYTAFVDEQALGIHWKNFSTWDIRESVAAKIPGIKKLYSPLRILAAFFFEQFDFSEYDVVISSTNMYMAKAVRTKRPTVHICYCHTPPRSLYGYSTMTDWEKNPATNLGGKIINVWMHVVDQATAKRPDVFIANSKEVAGRIKKFYHRDSTVIYPPVSLEGALTKKVPEYYLYVNRLAYAKHPEMAVEACTKLGVPLKLVGRGKMLEDLKKIAGPTVEFMGAVDDVTLKNLYASAKALLYPVEDEDFGIVPVEAMMAGVPVIAHRSGGPKETIVDGKTGVFFDALSTDGLVTAMQSFEKKTFDSKFIRAHAQQFSKEVFKKKIEEVVAKTYGN